MDKKQLSICIPTYNRKDKIIKQIERIIQSGVLTSNDEVELIVSDNCSDDNTYDSLSSLFKNQDGIRLYHQDNNLGLVGNLYFLFDIAKGEYIWFLSDDDPINPKSIGHLLSIMGDDPRSFYLLNFITDNNSELYWKESNDYLSLFNDKTWGGFGLLSAQVLKKDSFSSFYSSTKDKYNLCQPVAVSLYGLLYLDGKMCFDIVSITHHVGDYSWKSHSMEVFSKDLFYSIYLLKDYNRPQIYKKVLDVLKSLKLFCGSSFAYIIKKKDVVYVRSLLKENLLLSVIIKGGYFCIKGKIKSMCK